MMDEFRLLGVEHVGEGVHALVEQHAAAHDGGEAFVRLGRHQAQIGVHHAHRPHAVAPHAVLGVELGALADLLFAGGQRRQPGNVHLRRDRLGDAARGAQLEGQHAPVVVARPCAAADLHGEILLAGDLVGDRGASVAIHVVFPQQGSVAGVVGGELAIAVALEDDAAGGGQHAAVVRRGAFHRPQHLAGHGIECLEVALGFRLRRGRGSEFRVARPQFDAEADAGLADLELAGSLELLGQRVEQGDVLHGEIGHAARGIHRHRLPAVAAGIAGKNPRRRLLVVGRRVLHRPGSFHVDVDRPVQAGVGCRAQQLAVLPAQHVEEAVLRRLEEHFVGHAVQGHVEQGDVLRGVEVPVVGRRHLMEPLHAPAVGIEGENSP